MVQRTIDLKELIIDAIRKKHSTIKSVVEYVKGIDKSIKVDDIKDTIHQLEKDKRIELIEPYFAGNFIDYLRSINAINLWFVISVTCIVVASIYALSETLSLVRIVIGGIFVLFIPGYALISMLFNKHDMIEKVALSIGSSLAIVPLIGLILNYTPLGIRLDPVVTMLSLFSITLMLVATYKQYKRCKDV